MSKFVVPGPEPEEPSGAKAAAGLAYLALFLFICTGVPLLTIAMFIRIAGFTD